MFLLHESKTCQCTKVLRVNETLLDRSKYALIGRLNVCVIRVRRLPKLVETS